MRFSSTEEGIQDHYNQIRIYDSKRCLSDNLKSYYKNKSEVVSEKLCFMSHYKKVQLGTIIENENGFKSYFDPKYIKYAKNFPGAIWYLASSKDTDENQGDGGLLILKFGSKIIIIAPYHFEEMTYLTDLSTKNKRQLKRFNKILKELEEYRICFPVSKDSVIESLKILMED